MLKSNRLLLIIIPVILFYIVGCTTTPNTPSSKQLFDFNWTFHKGDIPSVNAIDFSTQKWRSIDLPHNWNMDEKLVQNKQTKGIGWYSKSFDIPSSWKHKKIAIYFDGIDKDNEVFLNGNLLDMKDSKNNTCSCDLTQHLNYRKGNKIAVRINNLQELNDTRSDDSGIYKHVWLIVTDSNLFSAR